MAAGIADRGTAPGTAEAGIARAGTGDLGTADLGTAEGGIAEAGIAGAEGSAVGIAVGGTAVIRSARTARSARLALSVRLANPAARAAVQAAGPVGRVEPVLIQVHPRAGLTRPAEGPSSPRSDLTNDALLAAGDPRWTVAPALRTHAPCSGSAGSSRHRRPDRTARRKNPRGALQNSRLLPVATEMVRAGQNLGTPGWVKYHNAELNQMTVRSTASSPPSTGSAHPGRPRSRRDSILAANAP